MWGLWEATFLYIAFGTSLPDVLTKAEYLFEPQERGLNLWFMFDFSLLSLPVAIAFIAGRVSGIGFMCACIVVLADVIYFITVVWFKGACVDVYRTQVKEAKRRLAALKRGEPEPAEPPVGVADMESDIPVADAVGVVGA